MTGPLHELRIAGARRVLGIVPSWDLPPIADRALSAGVYSPALHDLACTTRPIASDVEPLLDRAFAELGLVLPNRAQAAWDIARDGMRRLVDGHEPPRAVLSLLREASTAATDVLPDRGSLGSGLDLGQLLGTFYSYDCPNENYYEPEGRFITDEAERVAILDRICRDEARAWLARHPE